MRRLWILFCLLFTIPLSAQTDTIPNDLPATIFENLTVSNVEIRLPATDSIEFPELHFVVNETVCEVNIEFDSRVMALGTLAVNVYGAYEDYVCDEPAPSEQSVELSRFTEDQRYIVLVNNFSSQFYLPSREDGTSSEPFAVAWDADSSLIPFERSTSFINDVDIDLLDDETVSLTLSGDHPDGCETDTFTVIRPNHPFTNEYVTEVMRLLPQGVACPSALQPYDISAEVNRNSTFAPVSLASFVVDDVIYTRFDDAWEAMTEIPVAVTDVSVSQNNISLELDVPENCQSLTGARTSDFFSEVAIVVRANSESDCDGDLVSETLSFRTPTLPIFINGTAYDENGIISPQATAQSDQNSDEGNFMRVDTVIDSVDVIVLESFPMQLQVTVTGSQPDGCDLPVQVEQTVEDDVVTVEIYRDVPLDVMCPAVLLPYEETIDIDGSFEGGTITININDFSTSVDL